MFCRSGPLTSTQVQAMEFSREEQRYAPVEILRSTRSAVMLKVMYSSMTSPKLEVPLQALVVNTHKFDSVYELTEEYTLARRCGVHKNLVAPHVSFTAPPGDDRPGHLWVVMPLVSRVSLRSMMMMSSAFRNGLPEPVVAFVLGEILEGLDCIHRVGGNVHGNVCAGCIYMDDETTTVKLAFRSLTCEEVTAPWRECKMEPEMTEPSLPPYETAADIWSFGLLILELLYGEIPVDTHDGLLEFINNVIIVPKSRKYVYRVMKPLCGRNPAGSGGAGRVSGPLGEIIKECLRKDPKKRPTVQQLLEHDYFKLSKGKGKRWYDVKKVLVRLQKHAVS